MVKFEGVLTRAEASEAHVGARRSAAGAERRGKVFGRLDMEMFEGQLPLLPATGTVNILAAHIEPGIAVF